MSVNGNLHIDRALTNMSVAYAQDASVFIADKVFPVIPVQKQSDVYYSYNKADFFADTAEERAKGTQSAGGDYRVQLEDPYYCRVYAYHEMIDDRDRANADQPLNLDRDAMENITHKALLKREVLWADKYFKAGVWGTDITGVGTTPSTNQVLQFNNDASDPIKVITEYSTKMMEETAKRPNTIVMSPYVYDALCNHGDIIDRIKYTQKGIVGEDLLAALFHVDRILVPRAVRNTAALGKEDASMSFIMGKNLLLCYTENRPGIKRATAGYTFAWTGYEGANSIGGRINRFQMPWLGIGTERIEVEMAFDQRIVCKDLGVMFKDIVA